MLSGVSSKFFTTSLHTSSSSRNQSQPSPFHHPTPNLRQLAHSVHLAQTNASKNMVPASPTLAKLMKAHEERPNARQIGEESESREDKEREEVNWLMPPPPRAGLWRSKGNPNSSTSASTEYTNALSSKSLFKAREIQVGQRRPTAFANMQLGQTKKTSAFMVTNPSNTSSHSILSTKVLPPAVGPTKANKRKPASPKRSTDSKTLVLATPAKVRKGGFTGPDHIFAETDAKWARGTNSVTISGHQPRYGLTHTDEGDALRQESEDDRDSYSHSVHEDYQRKPPQLTKTVLAAETPQANRTLLAQIPSSGMVWVGETPYR